MDENDELLLTYGRGLGLVARGADAWGAEIEDDGKIVWFAPASQFAEDRGVSGLITGVDTAPRPARPTRDRVRVQILGVPLQLYIEFQQHFRELRREVRLLSLAHESDYPLAKSLSDLFGTLDRHLREGIGVEQIEAAVAANRTHTDLMVHMPRATARTLSRASSSCSTWPTTSAVSSACSPWRGPPSSVASRAGSCASSCARRRARTRSPGPTSCRSWRSVGS